MLCTRVLGEESSLLTSASVSDFDISYNAGSDMIIGGSYKSYTETSSTVIGDGSKEIQVDMG